MEVPPMPPTWWVDELEEALTDIIMETPPILSPVSTPVNSPVCEHTDGSVEDLYMDCDFTFEIEEPANANRSNNDSVDNITVTSSGISICSISSNLAKRRWAKINCDFEENKCELYNDQNEKGVKNADVDYSQVNESSVSNDENRSNIGVRWWLECPLTFLTEFNSSGTNEQLSLVGGAVGPSCELLPDTTAHSSPVSCTIPYGTPCTPTTQKGHFPIDTILPFTPCETIQNTDKTDTNCTSTLTEPVTPSNNGFQLTSLPFQPETRYTIPPPAPNQAPAVTETTWVYGARPQMNTGLLYSDVMWGKSFWETPRPTHAHTTGVETFVVGCEEQWELYGECTCDWIQRECGFKDSNTCRTETSMDYSNYDCYNINVGRLQ